MAGRRSPLGLGHPRETRVVLDYRGEHAGRVPLPESLDHADGFVELSRRSARPEPGLVRTTWEARTVADEVPTDALERYAEGMDRDALLAEVALCVPAPPKTPAPPPPRSSLRLVIAAFFTGGLFGVLVALVVMRLARRRR